MTGLRSRAAAVALVVACVVAPASAGAPPARAPSALLKWSQEMNRLVRERPELFEAIGAAFAEAEARQDAAMAYRRRWEALGRYCAVADCGPR